MHSMGLRSNSPWRRLTGAGLILALTFAVSNWDIAEARSPGRHSHRSRVAHKRVIHGPSYRPPYAAIVVDGRSGEVLHNENADEPRHPASLTKIMTLYLLFEQLEAGALKLDTQLPISPFAASQPPTKLHLKAGKTISVEDAIGGLVTRSANDAAVVVSEALAGSEAGFAQLMTARARSLGMAGTTYVNASGLPADEQITTARDQALLGLAIQERFPDYYRYFSVVYYNYRGQNIHNHNTLLEQVEGADGIKTGYTEASGYNLTASVRRGGKHVVAVVLGERSNAKRDARMRELIAANMPLPAAPKPRPVIAEIHVPKRGAKTPAGRPRPHASQRQLAGSRPLASPRPVAGARHRPIALPKKPSPKTAVKLKPPPG